MKRLAESPDQYLATAAEMLAAKDMGDAADVLRVATPRVEETGFDNWNGGTRIWTIYLLVAPCKYALIASNRIRLPPRVFNGEALMRPRVEDARFGEPVVGEPADLRPGHAVLMAAPPERTPPNVRDVVAEGRERAAVGRRRMVVEEARDHLLEPFALRAGISSLESFQFRKIPI